MAPLWPYTVNTVVTLDNGAPTLVDMTDPSGNQPVGSPPTVNSAVLWRAIDLANGQHTLVISMASSGMYIVVDALMYDISTIRMLFLLISSFSSYTVLDPSSSIMSSATSSSIMALQATTSAHSNSNSGISKTVVIAVSTVAGFVVVAFLVGLLCCLRRKRSDTREDWSKSISDTNGIVPPPGGTLLYDVPDPTFPQPPYLTTAQYDVQPFGQPMFPEIPSLYPHSQTANYGHDISSRTTPTVNTSPTMRPPMQDFGYGVLPPTTAPINPSFYRNDNKGFADEAPYSPYPAVVHNFLSFTDPNAHRPSPTGNNVDPRAARQSMVSSDNSEEIKVSPIERSERSSFSPVSFDKLLQQDSKITKEYSWEELPEEYTPGKGKSKASDSYPSDWM
jgi:hypothetical protein